VAGTERVGAMEQSEWLIERFEINRARLRSVAYRMLGSRAEADDAVQEAWIRLGSPDPEQVENIAGLLTTVVARVCMDRLRSRRARPEDPVGANPPDPSATTARGSAMPADADPEHQAVLADSVGAALLVLLDLLTPPERVAFVLHDIFAVPYDEIGPIIERSTDAARQLASRARRRLQGTPAATDLDPSRRRKVVDAFLAAARSGDFDALLTLLDPDVIFRADHVAQRMGAPRDSRGAAAVASAFLGRAQGALPALVDGVLGLVWPRGGTPRGLFELTIADGRITAIVMVADPHHVRAREIVPDT
jgi:RNA polymerase sigma factor (sigma-70 family)